jgi:hypothetical protein
VQALHRRQLSGSGPGQKSKLLAVQHLRHPAPRIGGRSRWTGRARKSLQTDMGETRFERPGPFDLAAPQSTVPGRLRAHELPNEAVSSTVASGSNARSHGRARVGRGPSR